MRLTHSFVVLTVSFTAVLAGPFLASPLILHEKREFLPAGWSRVEKHNSGARLPLRIGLTQPNLENMDSYLMDVAHPESQNYGKHWSAKEIADTFAPSQESVDAVHDWLEDNGIEVGRVKKMRQGYHWVEVDVSVEEAERLMLAEYHVFEHETGKKHIACDSYHIPEHMAPHVDLIMPTVHFDAPIGGQGHTSLQRRTDATANNQHHPVLGEQVTELFNDLEHCDEQITPDCLRALYDIVYEPLKTTNNSFAIVEYTPQAYLQSDLDMFARNFTPDLVGVSPKLVSFDGGLLVNTTTPSLSINGESDLDLQYAMSLTYPQNVTLFQGGDPYISASFNNLLEAFDASYCQYASELDVGQGSADALYPDTANPDGYQHQDCGTVKPANVISTSYQYEEAQVTERYTSRQCAEYGKIGLMGVTMVFASGDNGVAGSGDVCITPNGTLSTSGTAFNPTFPGTCPWITSVGATQIVPGNTVRDPETACEQEIHSGGGFSNRFPRPSYQDAALTSYMTNYPPPYGPDIYNQTGTRGIPDIAANGARYVIAVDGNFTLVYGGSAATPVAGSIFTLINDARLAVGKKPIGFVNPTIYSSNFSDAFNDITNGTNPGCNTTGFSAVPGWDPVTGLGTPNFSKLLAKWLTLP